MKKLDRLSAPLGFKAFIVFGMICGFTSIFIFAHQYYFIPIIMLVGVLGVPALEDYYLTQEFIKTKREKIILKDIIEVRQLLWWRIITDEYDDSMWINYQFLRKEDKRKLDDWLTITTPSTEPVTCDNA